jgi:transposase
VNGLLYVLGTGCQWRALPKDLPPRSTLHGYFMRWERDGTLRRIRNRRLVPTLRHGLLMVRCRG